MSTRATIAVRWPNGVYLATYLHFDGYPDHAGRLLKANYLNAEEAESLIQRGDIRCLDSETGEPSYYDTETAAAVLPTLEALIDFTKNCSANFAYVFRNGDWYCEKL